jgi:hypothetical protein
MGMILDGYTSVAMESYEDNNSRSTLIVVRNETQWMCMILYTLKFHNKTCNATKSVFVITVCGRIDRAMVKVLISANLVSKNEIFTYSDMSEARELKSGYLGGQSRKVINFSAITQ